MSIGSLSKAKLKAIGKRIDEERNSRGLTFAQVANKAGCNERTVRRVVKGDSTRTKVRAEICAALEISLFDESGGKVSDDDHGGYTKTNFAKYIGNYFAYRRSFSFPRNILRSGFTISWSSKERRLRFEEYQRYESGELSTVVDHSQSGDIFFSNSVGLLHFLTKTQGAVRLITISKFRLNNPTDYTMHGIVLTQAKRPLYYQPSAAAIIFEKVDATKDDLKKQVIMIRPDDEKYAKYDSALTEVERHVAIFALTPPPQDLLKPLGGGSV